MKKYLLLSFFIASVKMTLAQTTDTPEMADMLRSNGKIYVVVGVITIIFSGIAIYLFSLDRKIAKLEKEAELKQPKSER